MSQKDRMERFRGSPAGRARLLINGARNRKKAYVELSLGRIASAIRAGVCEVTGIPFELGRWPDSTKNPFAPSLDRIDPSHGYTDENVQVVIWSYNLLKAEQPDVAARALILQMAAGLVRRMEERNVTSL